jgi:hypothetical protein
MKKILLGLAFLICAALPAAAQGCGPQNPNCIVPTAPPGTNDNRAASTAFVEDAVSGVSGAPCTTTASSLQYDNAGAFGCIPIATFDGTNILLTLSGTDPGSTGAIWNYNGFVVQSGATGLTGSSVFAFGNNPETTTGLTYGYYGGYVNIGGGSSPTDSGTVTLFDNTVNLVYLQANRDVKVVNSNTTPPPPGAWWMAQVTTSGGAITQIIDYRAWATPLQSGFAYAFPSGSVGLTHIYDGGLLNTPSGPVTVNPGNITLTASSTNYVQINAAGTVNANTSAFTAGQYPMAIVVTSGSAITSVTDQRPLASVLQPGGVTCTGTPTSSFASVNGIVTHC